MANRFTDLTAVIEYVKDHVDILKTISQDINRPIEGGQSQDSYAIFCPLHDEVHKPSFNINTRKRIWRCFGACSEGGDVVKWVTRWNSVSVVEAVEMLAERFSLDLSPFVRPATKEEQLIERYQLVFSTATQWMHTQLINHQTLYTWYKADTGFEEDLIEQYSVGYCPSVEMLVKFLFAKVEGITQSEIHKLELDNSLQLNNALIYPIYDLTGKPARLYSKPLDSPPGASYKYLGTSNSHPLFRKDLLFGLYQQRKAIKENNNTLVVAEGFKSAMAANGVAVMGTNVNDEQIRTIKTIGARHVIFCFDGDQAGYKASLRVVSDMGKFRGMQVKIAQLPLETQCDTLVKTQGRLVLDAILANAQLPIEFFVNTKYDTSGNLSLEGKYQLLNDIAPAISQMNDAEIDISAAYLSKVIGTTPDSIRTYVRDLKATDSKLVNKQAEESLLCHIIVQPQNWAHMQSFLVTDQHFAFSENQKIFTALGLAYKKHQTNLTSTAILDELKNISPQDLERLAPRLAHIAAIAPDYTFEASLQIVMDLWRRRNTITQVDDLKVQMMDVSKTPLEAINKFRKSSVSILDVRQNQKIEPLLVADKVDDLIQERQALEGQVIGFDFSKHLPTLNTLLSGIQMKHQIVIAANQGVGKSLLAANIADPIAIDQKVETLWINQEMPEEDCVMRLYSIRTGINNSRIQMGHWKNNEEYLLYRQAREDYSKSKLYFYKPVTGTIDEIYGAIEEFKFKYGIKVVIYDYMQLVVGSKDQRGASREEIVSNVSNVFTNMVVGTLGLASICIAQLNRENFKEGEVRKAENIGSSYKISQDATDMITMVKKSTKQMEEDGPTRGNRVISLTKRRGGPSNINLHANLDEDRTFSLRFSECLTEEERFGFTAINAV